MAAASWVAAARVTVWRRRRAVRWGNMCVREQGDGANDIPMLKLAGLGVAFHAKPKVKKQAKVAVNTLGLDGILYLLGIRDSEALVGTHNSTSLPETPVPVFSKL